MKQAKDIKHILSILGISTLFALLLFLIASVSFSYRKAENIEKFINDFGAKDLIAQGIKINMQNEKFKCDSKILGLFNSEIICKANDLNISIENIPVMNVKSVIITSETPALKISLQDIFQNFKTQIKFNQINFANEIIGVPDFIDKNITTLFNENILPQFKNINATFSYSQQNFQKLGFVAPIKIELELDNISSFFSFKLDNYIKFYKQPFNITFETASGKHNLILPQEAFFNSAKICWKIKDAQSLINAFYSYYQTQYLMAHQKEKFNSYYLDIQDSSLIPLPQFKEQITKLLEIAIEEQNKVSESNFIAREDASFLEMFFPFLHSFFKGDKEMCQTLSTPKNEPFSLTQMNYRLQNEGEQSLDEMISKLNTTFTTENTK